MRIRIAAMAIFVTMAVALTGCSSFQRLFGPPPPTIVLQVDPKPGDRWPASQQERARVLEETRQVLSRRVLGIGGVSEPSVTVEDNDKIAVQLPGVRDVKQAAKQLAHRASLEFYYLKNVQSVVNPRARWRMDVTGSELRDYTFTDQRGRTLSTAKPSDMPKIMSEVVGVPNVKPIVAGADLLPNAKSNLKPTSGAPVIEIQFSNRGTKRFADFTRAHVNEIIGVFYDDRLLTAPKVNEPITDGKAIIEGFESLREATEVAVSINAGSLPVHLKVVSSPNAP